MGALADLHRQGKVGAVGVSNFSPEQMARIVSLERRKREASLDGETASKVKNMDDNQLLAEMMSEE